MASPSTEPRSSKSRPNPPSADSDHSGPISSHSPAALTTSTLVPAPSLPTAVQVPLTELKKYGEQLFSSKSGSLGSVGDSFDSSKKWNTKDLGLRFGGDFAAAAAAGGIVAPVITVIDRGIIENASNQASMGTSVRTSLTKLLFRPHNFVASKPFLLIFSLYGGTYLSANLLDTVTSTLKNRSASSTTSGTSKFLATSAANLSLCLYKDNHFTKMFGAASKKTPIPKISYALFAVRDSLTVFASFNLPPVIAPILPVSQGFEAYMSRASAAQFLAPAAVQIISTPLHLLGLDLYNRPGVSAAKRMTRVVRDWGMSFLARVCRILPAFGVGGVVNTGVRRRWMEQLD